MGYLRLALVVHEKGIQADTQSFVFRRTQQTGHCFLPHLPSKVDAAQQGGRAGPGLG